ncbi:hypothetical protein TorRG33x02_013490 [Trema orientale]|uniref:Uncharacterized protein n=1 Tax=Trema orientale TaxID=63057 RepID=A0A2P5FZQ9_TREOI|nr:hypothetical protein TorRG33x02_013490 [Trema orientale]
MEATIVKVGGIEDEEVIESARLWWDPCFAISGIWSITMPISGNNLASFFFFFFFESLLSWLRYLDCPIKILTICKERYVEIERV